MENDGIQQNVLEPAAAAAAPDSPVKDGFGVIDEEDPLAGRLGAVTIFAYFLDRPIGSQQPAYTIIVSRNRTGLEIAVG